KTCRRENATQEIAVNLGRAEADLIPGPQRFQTAKERGGCVAIKMGPRCNAGRSWWCVADPPQRRTVLGRISRQNSSFRKDGAPPGKPDAIVLRGDAASQRAPPLPPGF